MTTDNDRMLRVNLAQIVLARLATVPGGLPGIRKLMLDTRPGPSSANLDPDRGGRRHDVVVDDFGEFLAQVPSDPTGEAVLSVDGAEHDLAELDGLLEELHAVVLDLADLHDRWTPKPAKKVSDDDGFARDWCRSCWRVGQQCTPVTRRRDGRAYHTGLCRWCGDLRHDLGMKVGALPPRRLVELHLAGQPMTQPMLRLYRVPTVKRRRKGRRRAAA